MKVREDTSNIERSILIALILSSEYNKRIQPFLQIQYLQTPMTQIVCRWCVDYYTEYGKAPGKEIERIYALESVNISEDMNELLSKFLYSISKEYENEIFDWEHIFDRSAEYFKKRSLEILAKEIQTHTENGNLLDACKLIDKHKQYEASTNFDTKTAFDPEKNAKAFSQDVKNPLFSLGGKLGKLVNEYFVREAFVCFFGKEKVGKSHILDYLAICAARNRRNVVLFDCGDNSETQRRARLAVKLTGIPINKKYCGSFTTPRLDCYKNQMKECKHEWRLGGIDAPGLYNVDGKGNKSKRTYEEASWDGYQPCDMCRRNGNTDQFVPETYWEEQTIEEPLTLEQAQSAWDKLNKVMRGKDFKIDCHSTNSLTLSKMKSIINFWKQTENYKPDVIVVDYPDIMGDDNPRLAPIDKINYNWSGLRGLAQEENCLIIACSHVTRASYEKDLIQMEDAAGDRRKLAHVTAAFSLNQKDQEKEEGLLRVAVMLAREGEWNANHQVRVLQSLRIGKPIISSY